MQNAQVTLFSWGYEGWGNWTDKVVEAADAVERSRGWGPPVFVDIRASRKVRAEGFREHTFERRFGPDRYRWIRGLGNKAILTGERKGALLDAGRAADLLDLALELQTARRRVIYFCSCVSPTGGCHRHWVAPHVFKEAEARDLAVTVVEWPGFDSEPVAIPKVKTSPSIVKSINGGRVSLPLGSETPPPALMALPWFTLVDLVDQGSGKSLDFMLSGPAQHRAGGWQLPVMGGLKDLGDTLKLQEEERASLMVQPRTWPPLKPARRPFKR